MDIPYKQMLNWKTGVLGFTLLGIWYIILPFLGGGAINQSMVLFGFTFLASGIVLANSRPTVLGALFAALIGMSYFMMVATAISSAILWTLSIVLFLGVLVFELGIYKLGPSSANAKALTIIPMALLGFSVLLGIAGYNPTIFFTWTGNSWAIALNYVAVMLFAWLHVLNYAGYKPLGKNTMLWMVIMAVVAVGLSLLGIAEGWGLFQW
jgi:hypothetical protein